MDEEIEKENIEMIIIKNENENVTKRRWERNR